MTDDPSHDLREISGTCTNLPVYQLLLCHHTIGFRLTSPHEYHWNFTLDREQSLALSKRDPWNAS